MLPDTLADISGGIFSNAPALADRLVAPRQSSCRVRRHRIHKVRLLSPVAAMRSSTAVAATTFVFTLGTKAGAGKGTTADAAAGGAAGGGLGRGGAFFARGGGSGEGGPFFAAGGAFFADCSGGLFGASSGADGAAGGCLKPSSHWSNVSPLTVMARATAAVEARRCLRRPCAAMHLVRYGHHA